MNSSTPIADKMIGASSIENNHVNDRVNSKGREWVILIAALVIFDTIMVGTAFRIAYWIRFELSLPFFETQALISRAYYERLVLILAPLWVVLFAAMDLYRRRLLLGGTEEYARIFRSTTIGLLIIMSADFLDPAFIIARGWVVLAWFLTFLFVTSGRFLMRRVAYAFRRRGYFLSRALILGANSEARALADQLLGWKTSGLKLMGVVCDDHEIGSEILPDLKVIGHIDQLDQLIEKHIVKELVLAGGALSQDEELAIFQEFGISDEVNLRMSLGLYEVIATGLSIKEFAYVPLVGVNKVRLTGPDQVLKAALDYGFTLPLLILISPLLLLIAALVKLDSPGPVFHRRRVMGLNGREFDALKFRTMHVDGDEILDAYPELKKELEENHKLKDDPRVSRIGKYLRRYSLDELPQFFNVIMRDMSVVGPRMISPQEMGEYSKWGINLLTVRPGITGLWQVSGRSDVTYDERVRLDMHYIRNWTIWLDIQLIIQTIPAVLEGRGAY